MAVTNLVGTQPAITVAVLVSALALTIPGAIAHNPTGIFDAGETIWEHEGNHVRAEAHQVDPTTGSSYGVVHETFEQDGSSSESLSPIAGFSYLGDGDIRTHVTYSFDVTNPDWGDTVRSKMSLGVGPTETRVVDKVSYSSGVTGSLEDDGHAVFDPDTWSGEGEFIQGVAAWIESEGHLTGEARINWAYTWVEEAFSTREGHLLDPAQEDTYLDISENATTYGIEDPSGDTELWSAGSSIPVTDGDPVSLGDVQVTRTDHPDISGGKIWTVEHDTSDPFAVKFKDSDGDREGVITTYDV